MEAVRGVGIKKDLGGLLCLGKLLLHRCHEVVGDPLVSAAVEPQHRAAELGDEVDRIGRVEVVLGRIEPAIPSDARLEVWIVGGVEPHDPSSPAEARHAESLRVAAMLAGPVDGGVEVGHHLLVGHLGDDLRDDLRKVLHLRDIPLPGIELRRHRQKPELREAAADVLDVLVNAEDLLDNEHRREGAAGGGGGPVGGNRTVGGGDLHFAGLEPLGTRRDRRGRDRLDGEGEAGGERGDRLTAGEVGGGDCGRLRNGAIGGHGNLLGEWLGERCKLPRRPAAGVRGRDHSLSMITSSRDRGW